MRISKAGAKKKKQPMGEVITDDTDRKILRILTRNARTPYNDIAKVCGVSRAAIQQRVKKMTSLGVLKGSAFIVNPPALGYEICVYVGIILDKGSLYPSVVKELEKIPEITEAVYTLGDFSLLVKMYARDNMHLMELLSDRIQAIDGVSSTNTLAALDVQISRQLAVR